MSDNSRITIILSVAMALAVVLAVLLFVYMFYGAQTRRLQDIEAIQKACQASKFYGKPLPPAPPPTEMIAAHFSPEAPTGENHRSPPSILQRRQAAHGKNGSLQLRDLQLGHNAHVHRETPMQSDQANSTADVGTISVGLSPDLGTVPFTPTRRLSRQTVSRLRDSKRRPPIENHPIWESVGEELPAATQDGTTLGNRI